MKMKISPKRWYNIKELLFVLLWWFISARLYLVFKFGSYIEVTGSQFFDSFSLFKFFVVINTVFAILMSFIYIILEIHIIPIYLKKSSSLLIIITKAFVYLLVGVIIGTLGYYIKFLEIDNLSKSETIERLPTIYFSYGFIFLLTFIIITNITLNILREIRKMIGPRVLWDKLLGRYRFPKVEERIFMFMDLQSSTTIAEKMGHVKYSEFIQDCFRDISDFIINHKAIVYQFVGDEIVLSWKANKNENFRNCINLYFAYNSFLDNRKDYYQDRYENIPFFKASLNTGFVSVTEVGDVLNTAARIEKMCSKYHSGLLISEFFKNKLLDIDGLKLSFVDEVLLKGKNELVNIYSVESQNYKKK